MSLAVLFFLKVSPRLIFFYFSADYFGWGVIPTEVQVYVYPGTDLSSIKGAQVLEIVKRRHFNFDSKDISAQRKRFVEEIGQVLTPAFVKKVITLLALREDGFNDELAQMFKGFFQLFDNFLDLCKPAILECLKHVGAGTPEEKSNIAIVAEIFAGLVRATKHWDYDRIQETVTNPRKFHFPSPFLSFRPIF